MQKTITLMICAGCFKPNVRAKIFTDAEGNTKARHSCGHERFINPAIYEAMRHDAKHEGEEENGEAA